VVFKCVDATIRGHIVDGHMQQGFVGTLFSHDRKTEHLGSNGVGTRVNTVNSCPLEFHQRTPIEAESATRVNFPLSPVDLSVKG
ncbi:hypothetical protein Tco_0382527, partial [Tanacetum coccineum]